MLVLFADCNYALLELTIKCFVKFVLGDNFFKSANYTIEALCAAPFREEKENLRNIEAQILSKRAEISKFEAEYREVCTLILAFLIFLFSSYIISPKLTLGFCRFWHNSLRWQADMHKKCNQWVCLLKGFLCSTPKKTHQMEATKLETFFYSLCRLTSYWNKEMKYMHLTLLLL